MSQIPSEQTSEWSGAAELTESARHRLLAAPERRIVLELLAERTAPVDLGELATSVAQQARDDPAPAPELADRTKTRLHHAHLPKLDEAGVIDYDPEANRVEAWRSPGRLL
ncbi:DUF7344 domain-containing protein [Halobacterium wangiae]|uniref:DUF7344 domain-containing protein n=1 Tax=Halobacterium wangiae TaxID=2902623 RepID=UPI001E34CF6B|nr:hypothetical protein [Halobacterium wangiae]